MTWTPITEIERKTAHNMVTWIRTARTAGYGGPDWLPSASDIAKSALFERLRSGKAPLDEPPPLGLSCPWYAVVEDPTPHYAWEVTRGSEGGWLGPDEFSVFQQKYRLVEERGELDYVVRDGVRDTAYRFRLWFDPEWVHPSRPAPASQVKGGWFIRNLDFERAEPASDA